MKRHTLSEMNDEFIGKQGAIERDEYELRMDIVKCIGNISANAEMIVIKNPAFILTV